MWRAFDRRQRSIDVVFVSDVPVSPSVFSPSKDRVVCKANGSKAKQSVGSLTRQLLYCVHMRDTVSVRPAPSSSYCQQRVAQPPADTGSGNARTHHHLAATGGNACGFLVARWVPEGGYPCLFISLAFCFLWCLCLGCFEFFFFFLAADEGRLLCLCNAISARGSPS